MTIATEEGMDTKSSRTLYALGGLLLLILGCWENIYAYSSAVPVLVGFLFFCAGSAFVALVLAPNKPEWSAYVVTFFICFHWAGVAAIYANHFGDVGQTSLDAAYFFDLISFGDVASMSDLDLYLYFENGGAIILWRRIYSLFSSLGFAESPYIGISFNVTLVALTAVLGTKMVRVVFGNDLLRMRRFIKLFAFCSLFWLFSAVHLRDASILFFVSLLILIWLNFLAKPKLKGMLLVTLGSVGAFSLFGTLRTEFSFVPIAMVFAGTGAMLFATYSQTKRLTILFALIFWVFSGLTYLVVATDFGIWTLLESRNATYSELSAGEGATSMGNAFIVNQPLIQRLILGSAYLAVYPIPFWIGLQTESVYNLFKSFHVLYMYMVLPLFILAVWQVFRIRKCRTISSLFLVFVVIGFTLSIAYTSLETRHLGAFLVPFIVLSILPDLSQAKDRTSYIVLEVLFLCLIIVVHFAWFALKQSS